MGDFIKGFSRGLGFGVANQLVKTSAASTENQYQQKIQRILNSENECLRNSTNLSIWFWLSVLFFFQYIPIWMLIYGYIRFNKKTTKVQTVQTNEIKVPDRRYSCGYRLENVSQIIKYNDDATPEEILTYQKQGRYMLIASLSCILIVFVLLFLSFIIS